MNFTSEYLVDQALIESKKALPTCLPNPPVGCVIFNKDLQIIVSSGFTQAPGLYHAEAQALSKLKDDSAEQDENHLIIAVTLEPCAFFGRTPSCAKSIVEFAQNRSGNTEVIVAMLDPHPKNLGAGIKILEDASIKVEVGIGEKNVKEFISPFLNLEGESSSQ